MDHNLCSAAKDTKKPGGMPSPVEQPSGGVDRTPKQAPWGGNQKQSQPMPPRSEPLPPRPQVALPVTSAPRTQPLEQKLPPQKSMRYNFFVGCGLLFMNAVERMCLDPVALLPLLQNRYMTCM